MKERRKKKGEREKKERKIKTEEKGKKRKRWRRRKRKRDWGCENDIENSTSGKLFSLHKLIEWGEKLEVYFCIRALKSKRINRIHMQL